MRVVLLSLGCSGGGYDTLTWGYMHVGTCMSPGFAACRAMVSHMR